MDSLACVHVLTVLEIHLSYLLGSACEQYDILHWWFSVFLTSLCMKAVLYANVFHGDIACVVRGVSLDGRSDGSPLYWPVEF